MTGINCLCFDDFRKEFEFYSNLRNQSLYEKKMNIEWLAYIVYR